MNPIYVAVVYTHDQQTQIAGLKTSSLPKAKRFNDDYNETGEYFTAIFKYRNNQALEDGDFSRILQSKPARRRYY